MPLYWKIQFPSTEYRAFHDLAPVTLSSLTFNLSSANSASQLCSPTWHSPSALVLPYYCAFSFIVLCSKCPSLCHLPFNLLFLNLPKVTIQSKPPMGFPKSIRQTSNQPLHVSPALSLSVTATTTLDEKLLAYLPLPEVKDCISFIGTHIHWAQFSTHN